MIPFKAACTSLTVAFQLFKPNGTPIRADVKLALTQAEPASVGQRESASKKGRTRRRAPTAGSACTSSRTATRCQSIAYATYGDPNRWRLIAEANGDRQPPAPAARHALNLPRLD